MEPIAVHTKERKDVPLSYEETEMLLESIQQLNLKTIRHLHRTKHIRTRKESDLLAEQQALFQYLAFIINCWKQDKEWKPKPKPPQPGASSYC